MVLSLLLLIVSLLVAGGGGEAAAGGWWRWRGGGWWRCRGDVVVVAYHNYHSPIISYLSSLYHSASITMTA